MDPLTDILRDLRLESSFYAHSDLRAPWGLAFVERDGPSFHIILQGSCWLRIEGERRLLREGDLVVLPHSGEHQLSNPPESPAILLKAISSERIGENAALLSQGGEGEQTLLICGGVRFAGPVAHPLLDILPRVLLLRNEEQQIASGWLNPILKLLGNEALSLRSGSAAIMTRLADILVLQTIRNWLEQDVARQIGWLGALRDPQIGLTLTLIHRQAEESWTVSSLAQAVHLSRSVFYARFTKLVGIPPSQYLTRWRMYLAGSWISEQGMSPSEAADRLGYSSETAFSRAFKRYMKVPPGALSKGRDNSTWDSAS